MPRPPFRRRRGRRLHRRCVVRRLREFCPRLGALDRPDFERLLVDRRGRNTRRLKNAVKRFAWDLSVRQGAAGEAILNEFIEFHDDYLRK